MLQYVMRPSLDKLVVWRPRTGRGANIPVTFQDIVGNDFAVGRCTVDHLFDSI